MANKDLQSWVRLDVYHLRNPKQRRAGLFGRALWIAGLCYAYAENTDGHIPADVLDLLAAEVQVTQEQAQEAATKLMDVGLWELEPDGWQIHDYEHCQETSGERESRRAQDRERQRRRRAKGVADQRKRDKSQDVTRDTRVSHGDVLDPETESDTETEELVTTRCREQTMHHGASRSASINVPPTGGISSNDRFEELWGTYPRRDGRKVGKAQAQAQWQKLTPADQTLALAAVAHYAAERGGPGQLSPEDAQRWLRDKRFVDWAEPPDETPTHRNGRNIAGRLANLRAQPTTPKGT